MSAYNLLNDTEKAAVEDAIAQAELRTSGEIRVHIESSCSEDVLDHAAFIFAELKMHKTRDRNGVLIYVSADDRKLAIIGDTGIHEKVHDQFWKEVRDLMLDHFKRGAIAEGLCAGIALSGEKLRTYFPYQSDDVDELSNEISFGA
ncbi:MAG: TPM domain-containing protein [Flavobacteriales bacterium]|nr:TPM domain-containing protein [Flavobacteriales bacterium]